VTYNPWAGKVSRVAIYGQGLTSEQAARHYVMWTKNLELDESEKNSMLALYSFSERGGSIVHNSVGSGPALHIPESFRVLHKRILTPPWKEFSPSVGYALDVLINVAGFMPFGFFVCAYLMGNRPWKRAAIATVVAGGIISVAIEILQAFIPVRSSGMTDIITNTAGTALGVMLWKIPAVQGVACKLGYRREKLEAEDEASGGAVGI
jgi:VanZ family protein